MLKLVTFSSVAALWKQKYLDKTIRIKGKVVFETKAAK